MAANDAWIREFSPVEIEELEAAMAVAQSSGKAAGDLERRAFIPMVPTKDGVLSDAELL